MSVEHIRNIGRKEKLTKEEFAAFATYVGHDGTEFTAFLRGDKGSSWPDEEKEKYLNYRDQIQNVLLRQSLPASVTCYRFISLRGIRNEVVRNNIQNMKIGDVLTDKSFMSTFLELKEDNEIFKEYIARVKNSCCVYKINVPRGFPAMWVGEITKKVLPWQSDEDELLLPHDTRLELVEKYQHPNWNATVYVMNALPPITSKKTTKKTRHSVVGKTAFRKVPEKTTRKTKKTRNSVVGKNSFRKGPRGGLQRLSRNGNWYYVKI